jgi:site-specific DNA-methyltransferase (adenine-specific)
LILISALLSRCECLRIGRTASLGSREGDLELEPFIGSGTTGLVALNMNRRFVGVVLNPDFVSIAAKRLDGAIIHA